MFLMETIPLIILRTLWISGTAVVLSLLWSLPLAYLLSRKPGLAKIMVPVFDALIGVPTVLIGLVLYMLFSSRGPLGFLGLLYTPYAIIIGEAILVTPLITSTTYHVLNNVINTYGELALTLGATDKQAMMVALREGLPGVLASTAMAFSRASGELGIALMVGGNIKGYTRVMTTAIALEVSRGEFESAIMLGVVLVIIVVSTSIAIRFLQRKVYG